MKAASRNEAGNQPSSELSPKQTSLLSEANSSGEVGGSGETPRQIRLANVRAKVKALSGKNLRAFDAITDLIAEASINKASLLDSRRAALEMVKLLAMPNGQRRATTYRDLCELGRNLQLPPNWHGSERRHLYVWYHCLARMRLVEVEAGGQLLVAGETGDSAYWLLTGTMDEHRTAPPPGSPPKSPLKTRLSVALSLRECRSAARDDVATAAAAAVAAAAAAATTVAAAAAAAATTAAGTETPPPSETLTPTSTFKPYVKPVKPFARLGQEALQNMPYTVDVEATGPCQLAALSRSDYQAVVALAARESFEGLRAMASLLANKPTRHPKAISDLASLLSVTEMFRSMDPEFTNELCGLLEFLALPEGTILFEEGDKVDFTYLILKGEVVLYRYNEARNMSDDFAVKTTGQQFGSLSTHQVGAAAAAAVASTAGGGGGGGGAVAAVAGGASGTEKKRNFSARCTQLTEFAIVTKVGYTRLLRNQLQKSINTRLSLLRGMAIMSNSTSQSTLTRIAINCQDETFSSGSVLVDPSCPPSRLFFIVEGQAKMLWVADSPGQAPPSSDRPMDASPPSGSVSMSGSAAVGPGADGGGGAVAALMRDGRSIKRKQQPYVYELALLSRGDVVNGMVLHGRTTCFTVVAATNLKVMSLEVAGGQVVLDQVFGREQAAMLRELVLLQSEVHRERAAHMVAVRQSSIALMDHRAGASASSPTVPESATFLQHYVPKTPGVDATPSTPLLGFAAALSRPSLFIPGAVQHGDVMKLVAAAGQSVLDNLPSPAAAPPAPTPLRRGGGGGGGTASGAARGASQSGSAASFSAPSSSPSPSPMRQASRDPQSFSGASPPFYHHLHQHPHLQQEAGLAAAAAVSGQEGPGGQHVTTVVAQPVAVPRTRMRVPSPGMARELGLEVPPALQPGMAAQASSASSFSAPSIKLSLGALDRVSSLGQLPDPAGGKSRNGRPRAPHRTQLGLPFAGNVAMLVLENHSDLVKVVTPTPYSLDCVAMLRHATNVSYCDDDGQCEDESCGSSGAGDGSYGSAGHSVTVFAAKPTSERPAVCGPLLPPSLLPPAASVSVPDTPLLGRPPSQAAADAGADASESAATTAAAADADVGTSGGSEFPSPSTEGLTDGGATDDHGRLTPFSSMPLALVAIDSDLYVNSSGRSRSRGGGGGGGGGLHGTSGGGGEADAADGGGVGATAIDSNSSCGGTADAVDVEPSWRAPRPFAPPSQSSYTLSQPGGGGGVTHTEPLTLAASQSAIQLGQSAASLAAYGGPSSLAAPQTPLMPSARAAAAMLSSSATPLAAGQMHVPLTHVYRRAVPAAGASGTAGAMPTPVLAATAVVQPAVSAETAKLCSSRLTTIMSTGPLVSAAATAAYVGTATEAAAAAANAAAAAAALPMTPTTASLPPSTSSSYTRDYGTQVLQVDRAGSYVVHYSGGGADASPPRLPPASLAAAVACPDSVVILPRMAVYESALLDATAAGGGGGRLGGSSSPPGGHVRLTSLGPAAASAAAAAAAATVPGAVAKSSGHSTYILPALPATAASGGPGGGGGSGHSTTPSSTGAAAATGSGSATTSGGVQSESCRIRPPPRLLRSMDTALSYQYGTSRELLGYYSSNPRMATDSDDGGMVFTGGIGGRSVRYGSGGPGGQRRQGGGGAGVPRLGGVSLRDLAGVNGLPGDAGGRGGAGRSAPLKAQEGPELPLELDAEAPSLQNRKLSEPSLNDLKYILTRWSKKWSQERRLVSRGGGGGGGGGGDMLPAAARGMPLSASYPQSEPGSPQRGTSLELTKYGYTSDDLYHMAREQTDAVGVGAFKRPLTQLNLFGLPYIGGTPRPDAAQPPPAGAAAAAAGSGGGGGSEGGGAGAGAGHAATRRHRHGG